jgi:class I fructose-bisphosphate aldolase
MTTDCGKRIRLARIIRPDTGRGVCVAFDHGLDAGPMPGNIDPRGTMEKLVEGGADAVLVSPGVARLCADLFSGRGAPSLVLRLDWGNMFRSQLSHDEGRNRLIAGVDEAVRLGADAVLTFMFVGYDDADAEADEVQKNADVTRAAAEVGMPHIIEPMAQGKKAHGRGLDADLIRLNARMAFELGADAIKTDYSGSAETYAPVIESCPIPILIAGGPKTKTVREGLEMVQGAMEAGAAGVVMGRNIIQADDPAAMLRAVRAIVHDGAEVDEAMSYLEVVALVG